MFSSKNVIFLTISLFAIAPQAFAKSSIETCKNAKAANNSTESISRCLDGVINLVDNDLQTWINLHQFNLEEAALSTGRGSALKMFKRGQNNFSTYRENNCRWQYLAISPDTTAGLAYKECYISLTQQRIDELTRLAESTK